jgi:hypothetical protein
MTHDLLATVEKPEPALITQVFDVSGESVSMLDGCSAPGGK